MHKPQALMQRDTRGIRRINSADKHVKLLLARCLDNLFQQPPPHAATAKARIHVYRMLDCVFTREKRGMFRKLANPINSPASFTAPMTGKFPFALSSNQVWIISAVRGL